MDKINHQFQTFWQAVSEQVVNAAPQIVLGVIIIFIAWIVAIIVKSCVVRLANHSKKRLYLYRILGSLAKALILLAGLITALGTMGINVGALVAGLGLVGFSVGFALKDTLSNLIAGFLILFYQPFQPGDYVVVNKVEGKIIDVNLRYTVIKTNSEHTYVPNSAVLNNPLTVKDNPPKLP